MSASIVGIGGSTHDYAVAVIVDGQVIGAIEEERLSRTRYGIGEGWSRSLDFATGRWGVGMNDLQAFANDALVDTTEVACDHNIVISRSLGHHETHAAWALCASKRPELAILVADGCGSVTRGGNEQHARETTSLWVAKANELKLLEMFDGGRRGPASSNELEALTSNSMGDFYEAVTKSLGFGPLQAGKTMALAAYGDLRLVDLFGEYVSIHEDLGFQVSLHENAGLLKAIAQKIGEHPRWDDARSFERCAHVAAACQFWLERALWWHIERLRRITGINHITFSGGVALNAVFNGKANMSDSGSLDVPFAPGDSGTALGAAALGWHRLSGFFPRYEGGAMLGGEYSDDEAEKALRSLSTSNFIIEKTEDCAEWSANRLLEGSRLAWFQGRSEFGPRALGNRSILALATDAGTRDFLNRKIKGREWFRPYAPTVFADQASSIFESAGTASDHMQYAWKMRGPYAATYPAVVHIDGTARVQTVPRESPHALARLLKCLEARLGVGLVLNTSLNGYGMPIVESPEDAVQFFGASELDALSIGRWGVRRIR